MDTIETLGTILPDDHTMGRDAVHVAVMPVVAGERLQPGRPVKLSDSPPGTVVSSGYIRAIGIVDPFLKYPVQKGQRFWVWLTPGTITGLRHEWTHPAIDAQAAPAPKPTDAVKDAAAWLRKFADRWNMDYDLMIEQAQDRDGYVTAHGKELDPGDESEFWRCIETLTGAKIDADHRENFGWSCSC